MSTTLEKTRFPLLIGGQKVAASDGRTFDVFNPASGELLGSVDEAGDVEVEMAVASARTALERWATGPAQRRTKILNKAVDLIRARADDLARLESDNSGKPIAHAKGEVLSGAEVFEFYAGAATKIFGQTAPPILPGMLTYTLREPVGVCAQIVPWNYPFMMASWKLAPALAAGCTTILKPSELTPITALVLADILTEAGLPAGVINVLNGSGTGVGRALVRHPGVDKVAFTGGTQTGREILREAAGTLKRVSLELGGKSPNIVFADADLEAAAAGSVFAIYYSAGQSCEARSRLLVASDVYDAFVALFTQKTRQIRVGDPQQPETQVGSLISRERWEKVHGYVQAGVKEGATLRLGGHRPASPAGGHFYLPTILENVGRDNIVFRDEIFGPVVTITRFDTEAEAAELANTGDYGLFATVWTRDVARAHRFARGIKAGGVGINTPLTAFPGLPFGGYKHSGFGRELSLRALEAYTEEKTVLVHTAQKAVNPFNL